MLSRGDVWAAMGSFELQDKGLNRPRRAEDVLLGCPVAQVLPEELKDLPALSTLHPAIMIAVASQLSPGSLGDPLKRIPLDKLTALANPEEVGLKKRRFPA